MAWKRVTILFKKEWKMKNIVKMSFSKIKNVLIKSYGPSGKKVKYWKMFPKTFTILYWDSE